MPGSLAHQPIVDWYDDHARDLPWRRPGVDAWSVLVSEVMLQQTPVARVLPVFSAWTARWPTPASLAAESAGEAVRMWGRLGYPRRALRLHQAAVAIDTLHDGVVPAEYEHLRALPGVGDYTAAAVAAFAYRRRVVVLDTNVRRVLDRLVAGQQYPASSVTTSERARAAAMLPDDAEQAAHWSVAVMELGALVCTARAPRCLECPVQALCAWRRDGYPASTGPPRRGQAYDGTDRQCRGRILGLLRDSDGPLPAEAVVSSWEDGAQRQRAVASLLDDGLVVEQGDGALALP